MRAHAPALLLSGSVIVAALFVNAPAAKSEKIMAKELAASSNELGFTLFNSFRSSSSNLVFSPVSISTMLAVLHAGAGGETATELAAVLHYGADAAERQRALAELQRKLKEAGDEKAFRLGTSLWLREDLQAAAKYRSLVAERFGADMRTFTAADPETKREAVNAWVEELTAGKIRELFGPQSIASSTPLVAANAVYFASEWADPFEKQSSFPGPFNTLAGGEVETTFMSQSGTYPYAKGENSQLLELLYDGGEMAFVVLLPDQPTDLRSFENELHLEDFKSLYAKATPALGNVMLPRFVIEGSPDLQGALSALGLSQAFSPEADFEAMVEGTSGIYLAQAVHKARIEVDETGTEAAAATGFVTSGAKPGDEVPFEFRADRPFLFFVVHKPTQAILFLGRVADPSSER